MDDKVSKLFHAGNIVLFDAAMGTALQAAGQPAGMRSEEMNIFDPDAVLRIHRENLRAGSDVITGNTFGVSAMLLRGDKTLAIKRFEAGIALAGQAIEAEKDRPAFSPLLAFDIGPTGALMEPVGDLGYGAAEEIFAIQAEAGAKGGADCVLLETFADIEEFTCAARVAKKVSGLPVIGTMCFAENARTFMGVSPAELIERAYAGGMAAMGANCSLSPLKMVPVVEEILAENGKKQNQLPVVCQPNAGTPVFKDGEMVYEMTEAEFYEGMKRLIDLGISGVGGCCGTSPAMIAAIRGIIDGKNNSGGTR